MLDIFGKFKLNNILSNLVPSQDQNVGVIKQDTNGKFVQNSVNQLADSIYSDPRNQENQDLFNPSSESQNRLRDMLDSMPSYDDNKPSLTRRLFAGLVTGGDPRLAEEWANKKYNQKMSEWDARLKPLSNLAVSERADNTNRRLIASQIQRDENADLERERKSTADENRNALDKDKLAQKREFAAIVKAKNEMPNAAMAEDKDGKVYTWDKKTGQFIGYLTNDEGGIVESSKLPEQEKLSIQQGNELQKIIARGGQARQNIAVQGSEVRKTEGVRSADTETHIKSRGEEQRKTNEAKPVSPTKAAGSPKRNDEKVFPNGKVGRWDGQGWIDTGKTAK